MCGRAGILLGAALFLITLRIMHTPQGSTRGPSKAAPAACPASPIPLPYAPPCVSTSGHPNTTGFSHLRDLVQAAPLGSFVLYLQVQLDHLKYKGFLDPAGEAATPLPDPCSGLYRPVCTAITNS